MKVIEVPGVGAIVAEQVLMVSELMVSELTAKATYGVKFTDKLTLTVSEDDFPRARFVAELRGDCVPAAERASSDGVKLSGPRPGVSL